MFKICDDKASKLREVCTGYTLRPMMSLDQMIFMGENILHRYVLCNFR